MADDVIYHLMEHHLRRHCSFGEVVMVDWHENKTGTTATPGLAGWLLIALMVLLAPITVAAIVYMVAQQSIMAGAGLALIFIGSVVWGLSGWRDG